MVGDRESRERGDEAYYKLPETSWDDVDPEVAADLRRLRRALDAALGLLNARVEDAGSLSNEPPPSPTQLAFRAFEVANRLWAESAAEEQDIRQVITTLRTALAVCWDLYTPRQAEHTTVQEHMTQLRKRIEEFEKDLADLQQEEKRPE
jgi:hypothetical protein